MHHRCLVQMGELCHVICLVKLGRIDFVDLVRIQFSLLLQCQLIISFLIGLHPYVAIVGLHQQLPSFRFLQNQPPDEGLLRVS